MFMFSYKNMNIQKKHKKYDATLHPTTLLVFSIDDLTELFF